MIDGEKPENSCSVYLKQSKRIPYDVVQDVCLSDLKHQFSQNSESDDIHSHDRRPVSSMVEHRTSVREVAGSNPGRTNTQGL